MEINEERVGLLLDALRSGEYCQTKGKMKRDDCYCAMGVACELFHRAHEGQGVGFWDGDVFMCQLSEYADDVRKYEFGPPSAVLQWFGIGDNIHDPALYNDMMVMNDNEHLDFPTIADRVEGIIKEGKAV